jgi:hypothetical protein
LQEYEPPYLPSGFALKFLLKKTWGDLHYIGLNGIEIYDYKGEPVIAKALVPYTLAAEPNSVRDHSFAGFLLRELLTL